MPQDEDEVEAGTLTTAALTFLPFHRVAHPIYPGELLAASDFVPSKREDALRRPRAKA